MNLFIDTPQQARERAARQQGGEAALEVARVRVFGERPERVQPVGRQARTQAARDFDLDEAPGFEGVAPSGARSATSPYSQAQDTYRQELEYGKKRDRRKKRGVALRVLAAVLLLPVLLVLVFLVAYSLTCILNGATPEELLELLKVLAARVEGFARDALGAMGN